MRGVAMEGGTFGAGWIASDSKCCFSTRCVQAHRSEGGEGSSPFLLVQNSVSVQKKTRLGAAVYFPVSDLPFDAE